MSQGGLDNVNLQELRMKLVDASQIIESLSSLIDQKQFHPTEMSEVLGIHDQEKL